MSQKATLDLEKTFQQPLISDYEAIRVDMAVLSAELIELVNFCGRIGDSLQKLEPEV